MTLDFEGKRSYRITVEVSDRADPLDDPDMAIDARQNVTVTVTNVNEAPVVTGVETAVLRGERQQRGGELQRDGPGAGHVHVDGVGQRPSDFWISQQRGQLYFRTPPSYEAGATYDVTVIATDDDDGQGPSP